MFVLCNIMIDKEKKFYARGFGEDTDSHTPKECEHEPEMNFGKDSRPRFMKVKNPKCKKCGKLYR